VVSEPEDVEVQAFVWDFGPEGNVEHLGDHDVTPQNVEPSSTLAPCSSALWLARHVDQLTPWSAAMTATVR
jgi:hypothetical protein